MCIYVWVFMCVCVYQREIDREREKERERKNADRCCRGNHLSPISSLTLSPQHLLVTIAAISHFADVLSLHLSFFIFTLPLSPSLCSVLGLTFHSMMGPHVGAPVVLSAHMCLLALNHSVPDNSNSLCWSFVQEVIVSLHRHFESPWCNITNRLTALKA